MHICVHMTTSGLRKLRPAVRVADVRRRNRLALALVITSVASSLFLFLSSYQLATETLAANQETSFVEITLPSMAVPAASTNEVVAPVAVAHDPSQAALVLFQLTPRVKECAKNAKISEK